MDWISHCEIGRREKDSKIIMHKIRVSLCFYGRVQGVGFRYKLRYLAEKYSVTGWARNEYDGSVSTELQGLEEDIDKILQALYNDRYIEIDDIRKRSLPVDTWTNYTRQLKRRSRQQDILERYPDRLFTKISVTRLKEKKMAVMYYCPSLKMM